MPLGNYRKYSETGINFQEKDGIIMKNILKKAAVTAAAALTAFSCAAPNFAYDGSGAFYESSPGTGFITENFGCVFADDGTIIINEYFGTEEDIEIPKEFYGVTVSKIGDYAFYSQYGIKSVIIPEGVAAIGESAFDGCTSLKTVSIPDSVTYIGDYAFQDCYALENAEIPKGLSVLGVYAFYNCSSLESVTVPYKLSALPSHVFFGCTSLTSVTLPDTVTYISDRCFSECISLTDITLPDELRSIDSFAFENCKSLEKINTPSELTNINNGAFSGCESLKEIRLPRSVVHIGYDAFKDCDNLTVYGKPNTSAYYYAKRNDIPFKVEVENPEAATVSIAAAVVIWLLVAAVVAIFCVKGAKKAGNADSENKSGGNA